MCVSSLIIAPFNVLTFLNSFDPFPDDAHISPVKHSFAADSCFPSNNRLVCSSLQRVVDRILSTVASVSWRILLVETVDDGMEFMSTRVTASQSPSESGRKDGRGPVRASLTISS
jgi:hypothetical protein